MPQKRRKNRINIYTLAAFNNRAFTSLEAAIINLIALQVKPHLYRYEVSRKKLDQFTAKKNTWQEISLAGYQLCRKLALPIEELQGLRYRPLFHNFEIGSYAVIIDINPEVYPLFLNTHRYLINISNRKF
ncbi:hypothetical protein [Persicobacter psychrovividus]|uniref:Uncharacterized protein n=1 Tax=Persicobacter psychrovividus TaxID=387638 RepID=A0ABN6LBE6_9BACT|nr:hypothetical protein PEPS_28000 [Persicobacter psychrovividus]